MTRSFLPLSIWTIVGLAGIGLTALPLVALAHVLYALTHGGNTDDQST